LTANAGFRYTAGTLDQRGETMTPKRFVLAPAFNVLSKGSIKLLTAVLALLLLGATAFAQSDPQTGFPLYGSFERGVPDTTNRQNLNSNISFPVVSTSERGGTFSFAPSYNSLMWVINESGSKSWQMARMPDGSLSSPGWSLMNVTGVIEYQTSANECPTTPTTYSDFAFVEQDGTRHEFNVDYTVACGGGSTGILSGYATDSSGFFLNANATHNGTVEIIAYGPDGTEVYGGFREDTNGNYILNRIDDIYDTTFHVFKILPSSSSIEYQYQDTTGTYQTITVALTSYSIKTNFACSGISEFTGTNTLPSSITYPNGLSYSFTYEQTPGNSGYVTGRISKITLPNGGYIEYQYGSTNDGINCADGTITSLTRTVYDGTNTNVWQFSRAPSGSNWLTTVTYPQMPYDTAPNQGTYLFNSAGQELTEKIYQGSTSGTLLRTINTTWATNLSPATRITILEDNSTQSEVETTYDAYGNLDVLKEHDYGTGAPGSILRTTTYTYLSTSAYITANILNRVTEKSIADSTGTVQYVVDTAYDGSALSPCPTGVVQHDDTSYGCSSLTRGNPTSITTYTTASTKAGAETKSQSYDIFGNLVQATLDCCNSKAWTYSATTKYSYPDSDTCGASGGPQLTTAYTYNAYTGQMLTTTDPNNQVTSLTYDTMRRQLSVTRPDESQIKYTYNDSAHTVTTSNPINSTNTNNKIENQDGLGRVVQASITDASSNVYSIRQNQFDPLGRMYKHSNPYTTSAQYWVSVQFDALGRKTKQILQDNSQTTYAYSLATVTTTDPAGHQRKSQLDGLNRLVNFYEPDPTNGNTLTLQTSYANGVLNKVSSITQGSQSRTFNYDGMGRLTSEVLPENGTTSYQYNTFDKLTQRTDNRGVITTYSYDTLNRPYQTIYNVGSTGVPATATVTDSYGSSPTQLNNGRLLTMTDGTGSQTYTYDVMGRVTENSQVISGTSYPVSYQYNYDGSVTSLTYPSGRVVQPAYDAIGRPATVASGTTTYVSGITFNPNFSVSSMTLGNGVTETLTQSPDRLQLQTVSYALGGTTKFGETYTYNSSGANNGETTSISDSVDSGRNMTYTYDALDRVSTAVSQGSTNFPKWGLSWTYDRYGNRLSQAVTAGSAYANSVVVSTTTNHITTSGYTYDANGNMTNDGENTLVYNAENRAISAADGSGTGAYSYNGLGLRVQKTFGSTTTAYIFSGNNVIAEYGNGTLSAEYIRLGDGVVAQYNSGTLNYVGRDRLSTRTLMDTSGNVLGSQGHYPFGEDWYMNSPTAIWHFTSYERDAESGNDYAKFRFHANRLGRFLTVDPLSPSGHSPQLLNRYSYVASEPIDRQDVSGRYFCISTDYRPCFCTDPFGFNEGCGGEGGDPGCSDPEGVEGSSCPPPEPAPDDFCDMEGSTSVVGETSADTIPCNKGKNTGGTAVISLGGGGLSTGNVVPSSISVTAEGYDGIETLGPAKKPPIGTFAGVYTLWQVQFNIITSATGVRKGNIDWTVSYTCKGKGQTATITQSIRCQ
jgi:RHS repeat-associated protein